MKKYLSLGLALVLIFSLSCGMFAAVETEADYEPITAANEDSEITMWMDHPYIKVQPTNTTSSGRSTYTIYMAQNEIEGCQFFLAPSADKSGLTASVSDFVNSKGDKLTPELFKEYYTSIGDLGLQADQIVPYAGEAFDISADHSQAFYIKVKTAADTPAGDYEATVTVKDSADNEVKKAKVFLHVWKFALSEKTEAKTAIYLDRNLLKTFHAASGLSADELYQIYYDYLLENRICAYNIPVDVRSPQETLAKYLDNPRVNSFRIHGFAYNSEELGEAAMRKLYRTLSANDGWLEKAYFYPVDEPFAPAHFDKLKSAVETINQNFSGARILVPYNQDAPYSRDPYIGGIEFSKPYVNLWCPETNAFLTRAEQEELNSGEFKDSKVQLLTDVTWAGGGELTDEALAASKFVDSHYGKEISEIMYEEQAGGDEMWWYVASGPRYPFCNLLIESDGIAPRMLFWQQKLYNVEGFLYYYANGWFRGTNYDGWDNAYYNSGLQGVVHGNGILLWPGSDVGINGPVGSLRIESMRDGIEDYQYLTMYQDLVGKEKTDEMIRTVTTSVAKYNADGDNFLDTKIALGSAIERELTPPCTEHKGGTATCVAKAVCEVCGREYGEVNPQNHHVENGVCTWCGNEVAGFIWGDVDGSGKVDSKDKVLASRYLAKWTMDDSFNKDAIDFDKDGEVKAADAVVLARYLAKWSGLPYPVGEPAN